MDKPTITINGKTIEMRSLKGRDWRVFGEFLNTDNRLQTPEYMEKYADFIANFFDGVAADDVLNLSLEEILPVYIDIRKYFIAAISARIELIEKNSDEGKVEVSA